MNKIPDNASAARLIRLFNRNLGTDFSQLKKTGQTVDNADLAKKKTVEADNRPVQANTVQDSADKNKLKQNNLTQSSSSTRHQTLANQSGVSTVSVYNKSQMNINQRAQRRKQLSDARKQHNIESVMGLAMDYCSESTSNEEIDPDWFHQFIQQAEEISSKPMQELWGKILAGEIAHPGTFSFKSLTILKRMTGKEAIAFQHACQLAMTNRKDNSNQIIFGYYQKSDFLGFFPQVKKQHVNLSKLSMPYPELLMLMDIELIYHSEIESGELNKDDTVEYNYHGSPTKFTAKKDGTVLNYFKFTQTGSELAKLIRLDPASQYLNELEQTFNPVFDIQK